MIINTGNRTDIPAYYSTWFSNRLKAGSVLVRNPYNPSSVLRYSLSPETVDGIVFCTKNPAPMLEYLPLLKDYRTYWFVTITPYGKSIEPNVPEKREVMESFRKLSAIVGKKNAVWRYDPILIHGAYDMDYHKRAFEIIAEELKGTTETCIISFIDLYEKTKKNFPEVREVTKEEQEELAQYFRPIAERCGMTIRTCLEDASLSRFGLKSEGCMPKEVLEKAWNVKLNIKGHPETREGCSCLLGNDIGAYNTCAHACRYCYANYDMRLVHANREKHDPSSPLLIGSLQPGDVVRDAIQHTWIDRRISLFDDLSV